MDYINCPSYASLFFALHQAETGKDVTVISGNRELVRYCRETGISCKGIEAFDLSCRGLFRIHSYRRRIDSFVRSLNLSKTDIFYVLDTFYTLEGFYLAVRFKRYCDVIFQPLADRDSVIQGRINPFKGPSYLSAAKLRMKKAVLRAALRLDLEVADAHGIPSLAIGERYLKHNRIPELPVVDVNLLRLEAARQNPYHAENYDTMFVDDGQAGSMFISQDSLSKVYKLVLSRCSNLVVKEHPYFPLAKDLQGCCHTYPRHVPAELLLANIRRNVISVSSTVLITAARLGRITAISLIDLLDWKNQVVRGKIRNLLDRESNNRILFPQTVEELIAVL